MSGLRDVLLVLVICPLVPLSFFRPWIGVLAWFWVAYFVPHSFTWGFGRTLPVAVLVGAPTLLGFLFTRDRSALPRTWAAWGLLVFAVDVTVSTMLAHNPELSWEKWDWVIKSLLMTFVTMSLFQDRERLRWLYLVAGVSLALHGVKGGLWVLRTGGFERVWGPDKSFFADNNTLGLALSMILPVLLGLARDESRIWLKRSLRAMFALCIIAILFTYSRGAFLGLVVVLTALAWRSPWRLRFGAALVVVALVAAAAAPERLKERIESITLQDSAETRDTSTVGRLEAWQTATHIALNHPFFGEGFRALWNQDLWDTFFGQEYLDSRDAHSIYFEVLAEHGFMGLGIYLLVLANTLLVLRRVLRRWRGHPEHGYLATYAEMTRTALYPFLVNGAFIGVAYFDLYFLLVGTSAVLWSLSSRAEAATAAAPVVAAVAPSLPVVSGPRPFPVRIRGSSSHA
ncbi:MAG: putative O-glycosylation ligase, exosortase A system-associated [Candidatus Rokuibacteriota bacterium]